MSDRSVYVSRPLPAPGTELLAAAGVEVEQHPFDRPPTRDELIAGLQGKRALLCLLTERIDAELLDAAPELRIVANLAVGYDNVDVAAATARGVVVTNTPDVLTESVADFTWALILAITRRLSEGERLVRRGAWKGWALDFMLGTELAGKQLGIVGDGRIGRAVAAKADAFGMRVVIARRKRARSDEAEPRPHPSDSASAGVG